MMHGTINIKYTIFFISTLGFLTRFLYHTHHISLYASVSHPWLFFPSLCIAARLCIISQSKCTSVVWQYMGCYWIQMLACRLAILRVFMVFSSSRLLLWWFLKVGSSATPFRCCCSFLYSLFSSVLSVKQINVKGEICYRIGFS